MKKNYYAKALALTVAASMVSVPAFAAEGTDDPQAQEKTVEQEGRAERGKICGGRAGKDRAARKGRKDRRWNFRSF